MITVPHPLAASFAKWGGSSRHGERGRDKSENGLLYTGTERAAYLDKCIARSPSAAFPLGPPTRLLASTRGKDGSHRPYDTLEPLARRFNLSIETADMMEASRTTASSHMLPLFSLAP